MVYKTITYGQILATQKNLLTVEIVIHYGEE